MAQLKGGSTVGGKQIVSIDMMNEFIYQIQTAELASKMKKAETDIRLNDFATADEYLKNKDKNGLWQLNDATNNNGMYGFGTLASFSNTDSRFQIYAPHHESTKSGLYFRTGWRDDIKNWERVSTKSMLDEGLNTKFNKSGGDITGYVNVSNYISSNAYLRAMNANNYVKFSVSGSSAKYETNLTTHDFDKRVNVNGEIFSGANKVWHSGNLTPGDYVEKNTSTLAADYDLNNLKITGFYRGNNCVNKPSKISGWSYIEVIRHADNYVLQKIYSFDGRHTYSRTLNNNAWSEWKTLGGGLSYTQSITANNWTAVNDMYEMTITHSIGSENITSVVVTDSNKVSMFTGFQVISSTVIKVFCSTNVAGKIAINAIQ